MFCGAPWLLYLLVAGGLVAGRVSAQAPAATKPADGIVIVPALEIPATVGSLKEKDSGGYLLVYFKIVVFVSPLPEASIPYWNAATAPGSAPC